MIVTFTVASGDVLVERPTLNSARIIVVICLSRCRAMLQSPTYFRVTENLALSTDYSTIYITNTQMYSYVQIRFVALDTLTEYIPRNDAFVCCNVSDYNY